jgi:perosamine synthetase
MISYNEILDGSKSPHNFLEMIYSPENISGKEMILTAGPSISAKESSYAFDAAEKGWNSQWSKYLTKFEKTFANYVGAKYALATSSCTGALQIALMSLDIGPGDEVIVPDETWVASANAIRYVGAIPIFADVELDSWNIDSQSVEKLISPKTKAIIVVHMYGAPARMTPILDLAKKYKLKVVEDAAPAIGAKWNGKSCGTFGDFGAYSFQGAKLLVTGEGGMLVTNDDDLYVKAKKIWDQGRNPNKTFWIDEDGVKFKMSNVQAAIGLAQIERADELIEMKRRIFSWYEDRLSGFKGIHLNKEVEGAKSIYWMSSIRLDEGMKLSRDDLIIELKKRNVDTRPVFPAISKYPIWPLKQDPKPIADKIGNTAMNLPSGVCLKKDDIMYVCDQIIELLELS